jgi:hypothetical protein
MSGRTNNHYEEDYEDGNSRPSVINNDLVQNVYKKLVITVLHIVRNFV